MSGLAGATRSEQVRILATIAFTFREDRLKPFFDVLTGFAGYGENLVDVVVTTTAAPHEIERVERLALPLLSGGLNLSFIQIPYDPANRFRVTWAHKRLITERFLPDPGYSHFIYVEDDIRLSRRNFDYFLTYREALRPYRLVPGFLRYEYNQVDQRLYLVDHRAPTRTQGVPTIEVDRLSFLNPDPPYQACYILDRELAEEHVATPSFDREASKIYGMYGEPERANMALSFDNMPRDAGFTTGMRFRWTGQQACRISAVYCAISPIITRTRTPRSSASVACRSSGCSNRFLDSPGPRGIAPRGP